MAGIYIHIPFCKQKCSYCDFHFSTSFGEYRQRMIEAICKEIVERKSYLKGETIHTIYFGGGTPSLLTKDELKTILDTCYSNFDVALNAELTLEANPDDITEQIASEWNELGINRLSIGLQSFKSSDLEWMNRAHTAEESTDAVNIAQNAGFDNITVDLMYGLPNLTLDEWRAHIQKVISMNVPHISAYCLTVEKKTALDKWVKERRLIIPDENTQSEQFLTLIKELEKNDYHQYEISNFAKDNGESKHNSNYWKGVSYLGVGPSAHSFDGQSRSWNIANNHLYIKARKDHFETEVLSKEDQYNELLLTGLRTTWGVSINKLNAIQDFNSEQLQLMEEFKKENLLLEENGNLVLTPIGRLQADHIAAELLI